MNQKEAEREESNRDKDQPRYTREDYEENSLSTYPGYIEVLEDAIRVLDEQEDIVTTEEILGETRTMMTRVNENEAMTPWEHAIMRVGQAVIDEDLIEQTEVQQRLERALEHERNR